MSPGYVLSVTIICISSFPWNCVQYKGMLHGTFCVDGAKTFRSPWRRHHVQRISFVNSPQGRTNEKGKKQGVQTLQFHIVFVERLGLFCIPDDWLIFSFVLHFSFLRRGSSFSLIFMAWNMFSLYYSSYYNYLIHFVKFLGWNDFNHQAKCIWDTFLEIYFNIS